jgi:hypothetical protein
MSHNPESSIASKYIVYVLPLDVDTGGHFAKHKFGDTAQPHPTVHFLLLVILHEVITTTYQRIAQFQQ